MSPFNLENTTQNQHYISQAEQRLNAINPNASDDNKRIYEFEVLDRNAPVPALRLRQPGGRAIRRSLSMGDLFTFDLDQGVRQNFEAMFQESEQTVASHSVSLLEKLNAGTTGDDIKEELLSVFRAKLQNFARNPWSIRKSLDTFGAAANFAPTDPLYREAYDRVIHGDKPQRNYICGVFEVSPEEYDRWLRSLFVLFCPRPAPQPRLIDQVLKGLFEPNHVTVVVGHYPTSAPGAVCLLSDRGFNYYANETAFVFEFNISASAFAAFMIGDPAKGPLPKYAKYLRGQTVVNHHANDTALLGTYNHRTAYQCAHHVFAAHATPWIK